MLLDPSQIKVKPNLERFRKDLGNIEDLAMSIKTKGQIQPILINQQHELIAGGRRLAACTLYNLQVDCKIIDETDPLTMREIEVEENVQRKDFSPAEHVLAVKELHELKCKIADTTKGTHWTMDDTAQILGKERSSVCKDLDLAEMVIAFPTLANCKSKKELKQTSDALMKLLGRASALNTYEEVVQDTENVTLSNLDAVEFMSSLETNSADILLCDPPYGINISQVALGTGDITGSGSNFQGFTYSDTPLEALSLVSKIAQESFRFCNSSAHAYVFCAPEFFQSLYTIFKKAGWIPHIRPLIWAKPGNGQANMPERWPLSTYEMCLYARKENSKLLYARPDVLTYNRVPPQDKVHPTQKPIPLLQDLITRSVHPGATLIDPCMGSGSSIVAGLKEKLICKGNDILKEAYTAAVSFIAKEQEAQNGK